MERSIPSRRRPSGQRLYSSIVSTAPGDRTDPPSRRLRTSIYILSGAATTYGPTGVEHGFDAAAGDFVFIPAGETHVEANLLTDRWSSC
jgi:uncharacterized RmlC-like cupin family protein